MFGKQDIDAIDWVIIEQIKSGKMKEMLEESNMGGVKLN